MKSLASRTAIVAAFVAAMIVSVVALRSGVETDVVSLLAPRLRSGTNLLSALNSTFSARLSVLCETPEAAEKCRAVFAFDEPFDFEAGKRLLVEKGDGLLSSASRQLLLSNEVARIRRSAFRRDYTGVGMFSKDVDPWYFLNDFVVELSTFLPPDLPEGMTLFTGTYSPSDPMRGDDALRRLIEIASEDCSVSLSGPPFHTYLAKESTKREINILSVASLVVVALLGRWLFGSLRFTRPMLFALVFGLACATAVTGLLPGRPHALTFLFGTTLIGLGVDYVYHTLSGCSRRDLAKALLTTVFAFLPLLFSSVAALGEMAVFTITGLFAIFWGLSPFYFSQSLGTVPISKLGTVPSSPLVDSIGDCPRFQIGDCPQFFKVVEYGRIALFLLILPGVLLVRETNSPSSFHALAPVMRRGEARHAELLSRAETRLEVVDLAAWQVENFALKSKMENGDSPQKSSPRFLTAADLPSSFTFSSKGRDYLILPSKEGLSLSEELQNLFSRLQSETNVLLVISFIVWFVAIIAIFRRNSLVLALPVIAAIVSTLGVLGYLGQEINFFQTLSLFIVIGLGIDYSIFHHSSHNAPQTCKTVFVSFITSFAAFGALALTSFPVTKSMGLTLACGLLFAYIYSLPVKWAESGQSLDHKRGQSPFEGEEGNGDSPRLMNWFEQKEQSAGQFRIALMWWIYRIFGKNAAKLLFLPAWLFIYPFCGPARKALAGYYAVAGVKPRPFRHLLSFAWSMLDKTDACTLCKNPPEFTLSGDTGWLEGGAFLISTHLGTIEVLPALRKMFPGKPTPRVHAFQQLGHDAVFTRLFLKHLDPARLTLHAVEDIGVETAVEMREAIASGDLVLMAGDRPSAGSRAVLRAKMFGREACWPKGVFAFARLMESPVYAIVAVKTGWNAYKVVAQKLGGNLLAGYVAFLERETRAHPYQWYQFYPFFGGEPASSSVPQSSPRT